MQAFLKVCERAFKNEDDRHCLEPPHNEQEKVLKCYFCGDWIYAGDDYYCLDDLTCCEESLNLHCKQTAGPLDYKAELADLECSEIKE